ncbi:hypothetical protein PTKU64_84170 [Paraburkholderia terrae]|uniref:NmrA-like domain-containing protein n=2 Tax=Paraburkholderia terrae TaxID=311230 RepID=A0ABN6JUW6_9BURK|nr:hypothetical protein PTKU64_84170 [Paraburkholderia terrae]
MKGLKRKVLVVGGAGRFASLVVPELVKRGVTVRSLARNDAEALRARANGVTEIARGDLRDLATLEAAAQGVHGVFHIGPAFSQDEAQIGLNMVTAAKVTGVRKFVFSSVIQPTHIELENHASKIPVESALFSSELEYTILHPANFMQNFAGLWPTIVQTGIYAEPNSIDRAMTRVDYRDVAEVAAIALTEDRLAYASLELCSDERLTRAEIASIAAEELRRPVEARQVKFSEWTHLLGLTYDERKLDLLARIHEHYDRFGLGGNGLTLRAVLGRAPRTMRDFIALLAADTNQPSDTA